MTTETIIIAALLFLLIAIVYSMVGHAGSSGYLAVMALLSFVPDSIKPTSLILNIIVAAIASYKYIKANYFDKRIFLILIATSLPAAFIGGYLTISPKYFKLIAGAFLILASGALLFREYSKASNSELVKMPSKWGLAIGLIIGLVSGLIGVGGGIFLSPIIIMANWTNVKNASGIAALFILVNSISGLAGHLTAISQVDSNIIYWIIAVIIGGLTGSYLGTTKFQNRIIITCLFLVLLSAGFKFILIDFFK